MKKGKLSKEEIIALMLVDIEKQNEPFIKSDELQNYVSVARKIGFIDRKYNQIGYLYNILGKLDDLVFVKDDLYFKEDAERIFGEDLKAIKKKKRPLFTQIIQKPTSRRMRRILW